MTAKIGIDAAGMKDIARQIGSYLAAKHPTAPGSRWEASEGKSAVPTLAPGVQIWALGHNTVHALRTSGAVSLAQHRVIELAENSRAWHHQILRDDESAVGFAESSVVSWKKGGVTWQVHAMGLFPVAARKLDKGLLRLRQSAARRSSAMEIRMLRIPGVDLGVLWLETPRADQMLVYRKPVGKTGLSSHKVYPWPDFVRTLAKHLSTVTLNSSPVFSGRTELPIRAVRTRRQRKSGG
jgi:hypothetical protein